MAVALEELERMIAASEPADDFGPRPSWSFDTTVLHAVIAGTASLVDVWPAFDDTPWRSYPERDYRMLSRDSLAAMDRFMGEVMAKLDPLGQQRAQLDRPGQELLFDPETLERR